MQCEQRARLADLRCERIAVLVGRLFEYALAQPPEQVHRPNRAPGLAFALE